MIGKKVSREIDASPQGETMLEGWRLKILVLIMIRLEFLGTMRTHPAYDPSHGTVSDGEQEVCLSGSEDF